MNAYSYSRTYTNIKIPVQELKGTKSSINLKNGPCSLSAMQPAQLLSPRTDDITSSDTRIGGRRGGAAAECENVISPESSAAPRAATASIPEKQFAIKWENVGRS